MDASCRCWAHAHVCGWWGMLVGAHPHSSCLVACPCLWLVGDAGGCSPLFILPCCVLAFAIGGGWCGMVVGAHPCLSCLVACSCLLLVGDAGGCSPQFVSFVVYSPLSVSPHWVLLSLWLLVGVLLGVCVGMRGLTVRLKNRQ